MTDAAKHTLLMELWPLADRAEEKHLLLAGLAGVGSVEAFNHVKAQLEHKAVADEAGAAAVAIGRKIYPKHKKLVVDTLKLVVGQTRSKALKHSATKVIRGDLSGDDYQLIEVIH